jgi:SAM-dependent methyltransferase
MVRFDSKRWRHRFSWRTQIRRAAQRYIRPVWKLLPVRIREAAHIALNDSGIAKKRFLMDALGEGYYQRHLNIQTDVTPEQLDSLFERTARQWIELGKTEPYWSVLTSDIYKSATFANHKNEFYDTGRTSDSIIDIFFQRANRGFAGECCLELGCGVGRTTRFLAERFRKVIAIDVSAGNLDLCRQYLQSNGLNNVEYIRLERPADAGRLPGCDFFFSTIVLQHNPPPVIKYLLDEILGKIDNSGFALFQVPTHAEHYSFEVEKYLRSPAPEMEMHCIPMHVIFELLEKNDFLPMEVIMDAWTGDYGSHTFFAQKRERNEAGSKLAP